MLKMLSRGHYPWRKELKGQLLNVAFETVIHLKMTSKATWQAAIWGRLDVFTSKKYENSNLWLRMQF